MKKTIVAFGIVSLLLGCGSNTENEQKLEYTIIKYDISEKQNTLRVQVPENYRKDQMIDISAELREGYEDRKTVTYFYTNNTGKGTANATSVYLPKCDDCGTDKDKNGTPIQFNYNKNLDVETDNSLTDLEYNGDGKVIAEFINDISECKSFIIEINSKEALLYKKWNETDSSTQLLDITQSGGVYNYSISKRNDDFVEGDDEFFYKVESNGSEITLNNSNGVFKSFKRIE